MHSHLSQVLRFVALILTGELALLSALAYAVARGGLLRHPPRQTALVASLLAVALSELVAFQRPAVLVTLLAGYYLDVSLPALVLAAWAGLTDGGAVVPMVACGLSGPLGRLLRRQGSGMALAGMGAVLNTLVFAYSQQNGQLAQPVLTSRPLDASEQQLVLATVFAVTLLSVGALTSLLGYLGQHEERQEARFLQQLLQVCESPDQVASMLPGTECYRVWPGGPDGEGQVAGVGGHTFTGALTGVFDERRSLLVAHTEVMACPGKNCPFGDLLVLPVHDGEQVEWALAVLTRKRAPLAGHQRAQLDGLADVLSTDLVARRLGEERLESERIRAQFLTAQIKPHFLFNALNTVVCLAAVDAPEAARVVRHLRGFLSQTFVSTADAVPLDEELAFLESYLVIEKARFGERIRVEVEVDDRARSRAVPTFVLQPLVENALRHGIGRTPGKGGTVWVTCRAEDDVTVLTVEDDGVGFGAVTSSSSTGVGLANVHERLERIGGRLRVGPRDGGGARVVVEVPT